MEKLSVVAGNFAACFLLKFLSIFVHISGSIQPIALIWVSLERSFPPAELEYTCRCLFWSNVMASEVEQRPTLGILPVPAVTGVNELKIKQIIDFIGEVFFSLAVDN